MTYSPIATRSPAMAANTRPTAPKKRLVICMDGTGNTCIKNNEPQTNVVRLGRCIADVGRDGSTQQVYYHYGIGTSSTIGGNLVDSAIGSGMPIFEQLCSSMTLTRHPYRPRRASLARIPLHLPELQ